MRVKTEKWHNWKEEGSGRHSYFKKGFWKRYDRKKFLREKLNKEQAFKDATDVWDLDEGKYLTDDNDVISLDI